MNLADAIGWAAMGPMMQGLYLGLRAHLGGRPELKSPCYACYAVAWWVMFVAQVMKGETLWATLNGLLAAAYTVAWWHNRRKGRGKKALKEQGDKSRRRVQALVDQMTPSPIPSPVGGS